VKLAISPQISKLSGQLVAYKVTPSNDLEITVTHRVTIDRCAFLFKVIPSNDLEITTTHREKIVLSVIAIVITVVLPLKVSAI